MATALTAEVCLELLKRLKLAPNVSVGMARFRQQSGAKQIPVANSFHHDPKCTFLDSMMRLAPCSVTERR